MNGARAESLSPRGELQAGAFPRATLFVRDRSFLWGLFWSRLRARLAGPSTFQYSVTKWSGELPLRIRLSATKPSSHVPAAGNTLADPPNLAVCAAKATRSAAWILRSATELLDALAGHLAGHETLSRVEVVMLRAMLAMGRSRGWSVV